MTIDFPTRRRHRIAVGALAVTTAIGVGVGAASLANSGDDKAGRSRTIEFDVAEDGTRFVIDDAPVFDDGLPAYGNAFVTQGYIYPAGTLTDSNGVNPTARPSSPTRSSASGRAPATSSPTAREQRTDRG